MAVKIRLARGGAKKVPYYRVVVANATAPRDGDFLEKVGTYNPMLSAKDEGRIKLNSDRVLYWLSKGAQPTDRVAKFIAAAGIALPAHITKKMALHAKRYEALAVTRKAELEEKAKIEAAEAKAKAKEEAEAAKLAEAAAAEAAASAPVAEEAPAEEAVVDDTTAPAEEAPAEETPTEEASAEADAPAEGSAESE